MTMEQLEMVRHARRRIMLIEESIKELDEVLLPSHQGGARSTTPSSPVEQHFRTKQKLLGDLEKERLTLLKLVNEVYEWLNTVQDGLIRNIVMSRYILGKSWQNTATICYKGYTDRSVPYNYLKSYLKR